MEMNQKEIIGKWIFKDGKVLPDENCKIIELMIENDLVELETSDDGWTKLYKAIDGTIWELSYPESHLQGGGPPKLTVISE
jgi:hypothetical protein